MSNARFKKGLDGAFAWCTFLVLLGFKNLSFKNEMLGVMAN